jgi:hypothetical protein
MIRSSAGLPRLVAFALIAATLFALFLRYPAKTLRSDLPIPQDFSVYLKALERTQALESPYVPTDGLPYKYSPGVIPLVSLLPPHAQTAWYVFGSLSLFLFGVALMGGARFHSWREVGFLVLGLALSWKGLIENLDYGQLDLFLFSLALISGALLPRWPFFAGLIAGTLPWFKLPWALLIFPLWVLSRPSDAPGGTGGLDPRAPRRLRMMVSGFAASCLIWGAAVPSLIFGSDRAIEYSQSWLALLRTQPDSIYLHDMNQSIWILLPRWWGSIPAMPSLGTIGLTLVLAGIALGILISAPSRGRGALATFTPWILLLQLLNPLAWRWASLILVGVPFACDRTGSANRQPTAWAFAGWGAVTALWLIQLNPFVRLLGAHHWTELHPFGTIGMYWLVLLALMLERARAR